MIKNSYKAYEVLSKFSIFALDKIKPIEKECIEKIMRKFKKIVIIEDNFNSGLFNTLCQFVAEKKIREIDMYSLSPSEGYGKYIGDPQTLEEKHGISPEKIAQFIKNLM